MWENGSKLNGGEVILDTGQRWKVTEDDVILGGKKQDRQNS